MIAVIADIGADGRGKLSSSYLLMILFERQKLAEKQDWVIGRPSKRSPSSRVIAVIADIGADGNEEALVFLLSDDPI